MYWMLCNAGSPSISGAVIRKVLIAVYIQFINLLDVVTPSQLLQSYASHLMPFPASWNVVVLAWLILSIGFFWLLQLVHWSGLLQPLIQWHFAIHAGIACLHFACWDSMSGSALACWDSVSGFPGLWLAISDWCLSKGVCCKPGHDCWLFII